MKTKIATLNPFHVKQVAFGKETIHESLGISKERFDQIFEHCSPYIEKYLRTGGACGMSKLIEDITSICNSPSEIAIAVSKTFIAIEKVKREHNL